MWLFVSSVEITMFVRNNCKKNMEVVLKLLNRVDIWKTGV